MDTRELLDLVDSVRQTSGTLAKKQKLQDIAAREPIFKDVLKLVYDPFIRFYTKDNALACLHKLGIPGHSYVVAGLMRKKNLRLGMAAKGINSIWPGLIPTHDVMLAQQMDWDRLRYPCCVTLKLDGVRGIYRNGKFYFRNGKQIMGLQHLEAQLEGALDLDGELMCPDMDFQTSSGRIRSFDRSATARFHIIDIPGYPSEHFRDRMKAALRLADPLEHVDVVPYWPVETKLDVITLYDYAIDKGYEGLVVKPLQYMYEGKRSFSWMKLKAIESVDVRVTDIFEGEGKFEGMLGGLIVDVDGVEVRVGSGFTDVVRLAFWSKPENIIGSLVEIQYHEITPAGSLRHPRFMRVRRDK